MERNQLQPQPGNSDWRLNHLVLEAIFEHLDPTDLKSCSLVSKFWLFSTSKAFKEKFRPVVQVPGPEDEPVLRQALLQRFQRFQDLAFKLSRSSIRLDSIFTFLNGALMTRLSFHYEPKSEIVLGINRFLLRLTSGFPALEQLEVRPEYNGNYPDEELAVELAADVEVDEAVHENLKVLRVPTGPNSGSGIDWRFLKPLQKLEELHLLEFHVVDLQYFERQFSDFQKHFPQHVNIAKLVIHLMLHRGTDRSWYAQLPPRWDTTVFRSVSRTMKPNACVINFENIRRRRIPDGGFAYHYREIIDFLPALTSSNSIAKVTFYACIPFSDLIVRFNISLSTLLRALSRHNQFHQNGRILLHIDLVMANEKNETTTSFVEMECGHYGAPLVFRYGPILPECRQQFQDVNNYATFYLWESLRGRNEALRPRFNKQRKYLFDSSEGKLEQQQLWYPAELWPLESSVSYNEQVAEIQSQIGNNTAQVPKFQKMGKRIWRQTEFFGLVDETINVTAKPSMDQHDRFVSEICVYSTE